MLVRGPETIIITMPTGPVLDVDPDNAIICPNSSATMSTTSVGTSYVVRPARSHQR
ncbi:MAG: hypothetical protein IPG92_08950 [Flavobacteriales bacterium]|nr:hypothetical protein [Flavobacteriales bacterium]